MRLGQDMTTAVDDDDDGDASSKVEKPGRSAELETKRSGNDSNTLLNKIRSGKKKPGPKSKRSAKKESPAKPAPTMRPVADSTMQQVDMAIRENVLAQAIESSGLNKRSK